MKVRSIRHHALGVLVGSGGMIVASLVAVALVGAEAWVGWMLVVALLVAMPIGAVSGAHAGRGLFTAPPGPDDATLERHAALRSLAVFLSFLLAITAAPVLLDLVFRTPGPVVSDGEILGWAAGMTMLSTSQLIWAIIVWLNARDVERRWPVRLVAARPGWWLSGRAQIYALPLDPAPAVQITAPERPAGAG